MAIILPPSVIKKAAIKFVAKTSISEQASKSSPGEEAHIYNLYEELSMPLSDIIEIGKLGLEGKLENVQEKMDGQFLAFTVRNGNLLFFTKMDLQSPAAKIKKLEAIMQGSKGGGMNLDQIVSTYTGPRSVIAEGFAIAYKALDPVSLPYQDSLFRNGEVVIASQIMVSKNPNTILYNKDSLRTVLAISLTEAPVNQDALKNFKLEMSQASTDAFTMDEVPTAKLIKDLEQDDEQILQLEKDLESVVGEVGMSIGNNTVGDYIKARLEKFISEKYEFIPSNLVPDVADRFMTGKGKIALRLKKAVSPDDYQRFRSLDKIKPRIVQEAIVPLENIIQRLGIMIINKLDLALSASNQEELLGFVKAARNAFESGFNFGLGDEDTKTLEGIRVALARLEENEDLFEKATEGIVFTYKNKTYKLTGLFTPINRLRSFFKKSMGREGFGKASLPDTELSESLNRAAIRFLKEGGNAFKDSEGNIATRQNRISRNEVSRILSGFKSSVLDSLGLKYIPIGSTGTNTDTVGDIDIAVDIASKEELYKLLLSSLGEENVKKVGQLIAVKFQVPESNDEDFVQIDVVPSANVNDTAWIMMGGKKDSVKGVFRNLLLSYIAKIKSDQESSTLKKVKYTISFPGGLLVKINDTPTSSREPDPDKFLPVLGINVDKSEIETFEKLVLFMNNDQRFTSSLPGFKEYISNNRYLFSKDEKVKEESEKAVNYIERNIISEAIIRAAIRKILKEQDSSVDALGLDIEVDTDDDTDDDVKKESMLDNASSFSEKSKIIYKILSNKKYFGSDLEKIIGTSAKNNIIRFGLKTGSMKNYNIEILINGLYSDLMPEKEQPVIELAPNESPNPSSSFQAYMLPELENLIILFGSAGTTGGARKEGYIYEADVIKRLIDAGLSATPGADNSYSDIYLPSGNGILGIEVKLPNAQAGEPTLRYDFDKSKWFASNPKESNKEIADLINLDKNAAAVKTRLKKVKDAVNAFRETEGTPKIESVLAKVTKNEYRDVVQPVLTADLSSSIVKGSLLATYTISAATLRSYYLSKSAGLVQVKTKGLFHLHPDFKVSLSFPDGTVKSTRLFEFPDAAGAVYFRNFTTNYGIRAQLKNSPLKKLKVSDINLDMQEDVDLFSKSVGSMNFPDPKSIAAPKK